MNNLENTVEYLNRNRFLFLKSELKMDEIHRKVLAAKAKDIIKRLSSPVQMMALLRPYLPDSGYQQVERETDRHGPSRGTQVLILVIEKRGPKVFKAFVAALRDPTVKLDDLADELEAEEARLRGHSSYQSEPSNPEPGTAIDCIF